MPSSSKQHHGARKSEGFQLIARRLQCTLPPSSLFIQGQATSCQLLEEVTYVKLPRSYASPISWLSEAKRLWTPQKAMASLCKSVIFFEEIALGWSAGFRRRKTLKLGPSRKRRCLYVKATLSLRKLPWAGQLAFGGEKP